MFRKSFGSTPVKGVAVVLVVVLANTDIPVPVAADILTAGAGVFGGAREVRHPSFAAQSGRKNQCSGMVKLTGERVVEVCCEDRLPIVLRYPSPRERLRSEFLKTFLFV